MNVRGLIQFLRRLDPSLPVRVELSFQDGDRFEGSELHSVQVQRRCDDIQAVYLFGDQDLADTPPKPRSLRR